MRKETECKAQDRYLFTDEIFSDESIAIWKRECIYRVKSRNLEKTEAYEQFIKWNRGVNEIALFTLYAYADFLIPKTFDCIFELTNPHNQIFTEFKLTQSLFEGWYPINSIDHGHKHLCIFEFKNGIPPIFDSLHIHRGKFSNVSKSATSLGICDSKDFNEIKERRLYINKLRKKYGTEWWKYDETQSD